MNNVIKLKTNIQRAAESMFKEDNLFTEILRQLENYNYNEALKLINECRELTDSIERRISLFSLTSICLQKNNVMTDTFLNMAYEE